MGYNFLVGEDGRVYEGRGWNYRGAHARQHNAYSFGACIMGNFMEQLPETLALDAMNNLIACGVEWVRLKRRSVACVKHVLTPVHFQGYITTGHEVFGHRDGVCTDCPGDQLYQEIQTWSSYSFRDIPIDCN